MNSILIFYTDINGPSLVIRIVDLNDNPLTPTPITISTSGIQNISFTNPTSDTVIKILISQTTIPDAPQTSPFIYGMNIILSVT